MKCLGILLRWQQYVDNHSTTVQVKLKGTIDFEGDSLLVI